MQRREITAELVQSIDQMLVDGLDASTIATRLGVSEYVVGVIAGDVRRQKLPTPPRPVTRRMVGACRSVDAGTIRMIRRMLDTKHRLFSEIAREAGVSETTVGRVARGERHLGTGLQPYLNEGERYVAEGTRCPTCGALIIVVPCRACRAKKEFSSSPSQTSC